MSDSGIDQPDAAGEELAGELRALALAVDPVPGDVLFAARGSLAWRRVDAELAELAFDSLVDEDLATSGVRGDDGVRMVSFEADSLTVEVEISGAGGRRHIVGQIVPPQVADVELRGPVGAAQAVTDDLGRFELTVGGPGPASLRCRRRAGGPVIETGWVLL